MDNTNFETKAELNNKIQMPLTILNRLLSGKEVTKIQLELGVKELLAAEKLIETIK